VFFCYKELDSELRLQFLGDSSATPQNDVEFFLIPCFALNDEEKTA